MGHHVSALTLKSAVTVPDSYPLPRMEDCIDNIGAAKFVTKLDLLKGYWPLTPCASEISAFVTPDTFLQYNVLAFGLRKRSSHFSAACEYRSNGYF